MKYGIITGILFWGIIGLCFYTRHESPHSLPSRPIDQLTNWGQGQAPESNQCPIGTIRIESEGLFLECLRGS
jgi:hypothetical protein